MTLTAEESSHKAEYEALPTEELVRRIREAMSMGCIRPCSIYDLVDEALDRLSATPFKTSPFPLNCDKGRRFVCIIYRDPESLWFDAKPKMFFCLEEIRREVFDQVDEAFDIAIQRYNKHLFEVIDTNGFKWGMSTDKNGLRTYFKYLDKKNEKI